LQPVICLAVLLAIAGCKSAKSSNPLSPSVAGPIPGVEITAPKCLEPGAGWKFEAAKQPLTLLLENASTSGVRPLTYTFEVSLDPEFSNKVYSKGAVAPGEGGRTSVNLPDPLASERTYYWRARAEDGANTGPYSSAVHFSVFTPIVLQAPGLLHPLNTTLSDLTPTLRISNAARSGPVVSILYEFQLSTNAAFSEIVSVLEQAEQPGSTQRSIDGSLNYGTQYYWRARAWETTKNESGPWSATGTFMTPPNPVAPAPSPDPGDGGGGGGVPSRYHTGPDVVDYVRRTYPDRLVPTHDLDERDANMAFLRDRIIEVGICGGMDLAWNLKRGVGPHSIDALAWRHDGIVDVVDIGAAYNDTDNPLVIQWIVVGGTPGYDGYSPRPSCR
jgi:hypothetical protein